MNIAIGNVIVVKEPTREVRQYCLNNLVVDNPDYISRERMGKWTGNVPKKLHLYEERDGNLILPYGCKNDIQTIAQNSAVVIKWLPYVDKKELVADYYSNIQLYDYQQQAVKRMCKEKNGIVVMPCGAGKTQTALECVSRLGLKTLWLTHTQDLLSQSMERAKNCFGCGNDMFGTITGGKVNISKGITFATVQTMCKVDLEKYRNEWAVVVVDECQHCCGSPTRLSQFYRVINTLYAPYKFGLTATPFRSDGLDKSMYALLGDIILQVDENVVADRKCPVIVERVETKFDPDFDKVLNGDGTINYARLTAELTEDKSRLDVVMSVINSKCCKYSMVLANRINYLQKMQEAYKGKSICISALGTSAKAKAERKEALAKLNSGEIDCIFATYQLAAEGLDCPNLRYVVFSTPEKNARTVIQAVGRVARKADGKDHGTVIDFIDDFGMYKGWAKKRVGCYKKAGINVYE